jgi:hypothetical protein
MACADIESGFAALGGFFSVPAQRMDYIWQSEMNRRPLLEVA